MSSISPLIAAGYDEEGVHENQHKASAYGVRGDDTELGARRATTLQTLVLRAVLAAIVLVLGAILLTPIFSGHPQRMRGHAHGHHGHHKHAAGAVASVEPGLPDDACSLVEGCAEPPVSGAQLATLIMGAISAAWMLFMASGNVWHAATFAPPKLPSSLPPDEREAALAALPSCAVIVPAYLPNEHRIVLETLRRCAEQPLAQRVLLVYNSPERMPELEAALDDEVPPRDLSLSLCLSLSPPPPVAPLPVSRRAPLALPPRARSHGARMAGGAAVHRAARRARHPV